VADACADAPIEQFTVIQQILWHFDLRTEMPEPRPTRTPPTLADAPTPPQGDDVTTFNPCS
jgi:hypothetical protein